MQLLRWNVNPIIYIREVDLGAEGGNTQAVLEDLLQGWNEGAECRKARQIYPADWLVKEQTAAGLWSEGNEHEIL